MERNPIFSLNKLWNNKWKTSPRRMSSLTTSDLSAMSQKLSLTTTRSSPKASSWKRRLVTESRLLVLAIRQLFTSVKVSYLASGLLMALAFKSLRRRVTSEKGTLFSTRWVSFIEAVFVMESHINSWDTLDLPNSLITIWRRNTDPIRNTPQMASKPYLTRSNLVPIRSSKTCHQVNFICVQLMLTNGNLALKLSLATLTANTARNVISNNVQISFPSTNSMLRLATQKETSR